MALDPITMLLMVREDYAQERRDLLTDFCDHDAATGAPLLDTMDDDVVDDVASLERMLAQIDATLIAADVDPQPQKTNVVVLPVRSLRLVSSGPSDGAAA